MPIKRSAVACLTVVAALVGATSAHALNGTEVTACASYGVDATNPDECDGLTSPEVPKPTKKGGFKVRVFCMENPGDAPCRGWLQVSYISWTVMTKKFDPSHPDLGKEHVYRPRQLVARFAVTPGKAGGKAAFKLPVKKAAEIRKANSGGEVGLRVYTYQPGGRLICTSAENPLLNTSHAAVFAAGGFHPDERCIV